MRDFSIQGIKYVGGIWMLYQNLIFLVYFVFPNLWLHYVHFSKLKGLEFWRTKVSKFLSSLVVYKTKYKIFTNLLRQVSNLMTYT